MPQWMAGAWNILIFPRVPKWIAVFFGQEIGQTAHLTWQLHVGSDAKLLIGKKKAPSRLLGPEKRLAVRNLMCLAALAFATLLCTPSSITARQDWSLMLDLFHEHKRASSPLSTAQSDSLIRPHIHTKLPIQPKKPTLVLSLASTLMTIAT